jgi:glycerol uptake facilitator-like aquaporin
MFSLPAAEFSTKVRYGAALWLAESIATFGLVLVVFALVRSGRSALAAAAVGLHCRGVLVHGFDQLCQSSGDHCTHLE